MKTYRIAIAVLAASVVCLASSCRAVTGTDDQGTIVSASGQITNDAAKARALWIATGVTHYVFELEMMCFCVDVEAVQVTVRDGVVRAVRKTGGGLVHPAEWVRYPDFAALFDIALKAGQPGTQSVYGEFDAVRGFPIMLNVDPSTGASDNYRIYHIRRIRAL